jgi:hypothetical protein
MCWLNSSEPSSIALSVTVAIVLAQNEIQARVGPILVGVRVHDIAVQSR